MQKLDQRKALARSLAVHEGSQRKSWVADCLNIVPLRTGRPGVLQNRVTLAILRGNPEPLEYFGKILRNVCRSPFEALEDPKV